ncbi:CehA/McbA family metallohydrolase [Mucilaginibacter lutimaris]|uniref:CehA/McbA family metallohydrolase n=1 Tax=Mucilaginibacter lutimaris TaxID=931629 RepID=A0ABW2ZH27_9SPHI
MITLQRILFLCLLSLSSSAQNYHYYFGNIHSHSSYSDGNKDKASSHAATPADDYRFAKRSQHLDFLGISEHNHSQAGMQRANFSRGLADADAQNEDGRFVAMYGMEFGVISNGGHVVIYGMDKLIGWEQNNYDIFSAKSDYKSLFRILADHSGAFATLAHPAQTDYNHLITTDYDPVADRAVCGVAVSSGPAFSVKTDYSDRPPMSYLSYYKRLLSLGYMVGPTMDHDNHNTTFGRISHNRTVVLARSLSRDSIMAAYRAGRFYASEDWDTEVDFKINGLTMGGYVSGQEVLKISLKVHDPDGDDRTKSIKLLYGKPGSGVIPKVMKTSKDSDVLEWQQSLQPGDAFYYYAEIVQADGDRIYTAPIWAKYN